MRSAEDWVQVELRKKGGTTGQQKGVWLVAYDEEEVEMKKQQLKRQRPEDRQPVAASQPYARSLSIIVDINVSTISTIWGHSRVVTKMTGKMTGDR